MSDKEKFIGRKTRIKFLNKRLPSYKFIVYLISYKAILEL